MRAPLLMPVVEINIFNLFSQTTMISAQIHSLKWTTVVVTSNVFSRPTFSFRLVPQRMCGPLNSSKVIKFELFLTVYQKIMSFRFYATNELGKYFTSHWGCMELMFRTTIVLDRSMSDLRMHTKYLSHY